jgi:hemerythrin-like domain-containing protein
MKRSDALAPLSREHHVALEVALRLRRADTADAAAARDGFLEFFASDGEAHFRAEEEILLPAAAGALATDDPDVTRVLEDHAEIRRRAAALAGDADPSVAELVALGELLNGHVRHEERVLFPRIEAALGDAELAQLAASLQAADEGHTPPRV